MSKRRQHFPAHKATIRCAAWGKKYGGLFATGGDDNVVNVWKVGNVHTLKSLNQLFKSSVTSLVFNTNETKLAAGTEGGTIRVYDFEHDKVLRTLNGHLTEVTSLHFHPYASNYVISTAKDNNLKVWDLRGKKCLNTFRGHSDAILCSRFSPDGRLVATGGADNVVRLWDLTSGKEMAVFDSSCGGHRGSVTDLTFHPFEFVLASVSAQHRTAKIWDLEHFSLIDTVASITSTAKSPAMPHVLFSDKGGTSDANLNEEGKIGGREDNEMLIFGSGGLRSYCWEAGTHGETTQVLCDWDTGLGTEIADVMLHPKKKDVYQACLINKTHVSIWRIDNNAAEALEQGHQATHTQQQFLSPKKSVKGRLNLTPNRRKVDMDATVRRDEPINQVEKASDKSFDQTRRVKTAKVNSPRPTSARPKTMEKPLVRRPSTRQKSRLQSPVRRLSQKLKSKGVDNGGYVPAHRTEPIGLNYASFLCADLSAYNLSEAAHRRAIKKIMNGYEEHVDLVDSYCDVATRAASIWRSAEGSMATVLKLFKQLNGGPSGGSTNTLALKPRDLDIFVAILQRIKLRSSGLALNDLRSLVPVLTGLVRNVNRNDAYQLVGVLLMTQLLDMFSGVISRTIKGGSVAAARKDVVFAERLEKANAVAEELRKLDLVVGRLRNEGGLVGFHSRHLSKQLSALLSSV